MNSNLQHNNSIALWSDEKGAWLVLVTDGITASFFEVKACDEWVIPMAICHFNGINFPLPSDCDWSCEVCENSSFSMDDFLSLGRQGLE